MASPATRRRWGPWAGASLGRSASPSIIAAGAFVSPERLYELLMLLLAEQRGNASPVVLVEAQEIQRLGLRHAPRRDREAPRDFLWIIDAQREGHVDVLRCVGLRVRRVRVEGRVEPVRLAGHPEHGVRE